MTLLKKIRDTARTSAGRRELLRVMAAAPTPASRDELLQLAERGSR
jgi:hypothetical protein